MTAKIVYYGPGLCGKTTNLMVIFDKLDPKSRGKMLSLATKTDRTLFFDLLPVDVGKIGAFNLKIQLYTVPGQVFYNETRKLVLKGADAVVFVADSQPSMVESNKESFANLLENLAENNLDANDLPIIIQYNKRDIPGVLPVEELEQLLGFEGYPSREASAIRGEGVMETFSLVSKISAKHLINRLQGKSTPKPDKEARKKEREKEKEKEKSRKAAAEPAPEPVAEPVVAEPESNPFAASFSHDAPEEANPFGDTPFPSDPSAGYEGVEEVSLEELLEGRERPGTMAGDVAIPVSIDEDVEPLDASHLLPDAGNVAVAVEPQQRASHSGSGEVADLRREVASLKAEVAMLREETGQLRDGLRRAFGDLTKNIR